MLCVALDRQLINDAGFGKGRIEGKEGRDRKWTVVGSWGEVCFMG